MKRVIDRVLWTATGTAIGFAAALIAVAIFIRGEWL